MNRVVLPETREALINLFPAAFENPDYLNLLEYLLFGTFEDKDNSDYVVVPAIALAKLQGKEKQQRSRNYKGLDLLESFSKDVFPLEIRNHNKGERKARIVRRLSTPELSRALTAEFKSSRAERQKRGVNLRDGNKPPARPSRAQTAARKKAQEAKIGAIKAAVVPDHPALDWLNFLNTQPSKALKDIIERNLETTRQAIFDSKTLSPGAKRHNLLVLREIEDDPLPLYQSSDKDKTVRIFPFGTTYLALNREVRKKLMAGTSEFDLSAAQLTLAAHVWGVQSLKEQVLHDRILSPWGMLAKRAGLLIKNRDQPIPQKPAIKKATYTLLFGGGKSTVRKELLNPSSGTPLTPAQADKFLNSDEVQDIIKAQQARQEQYRRDGGFTDVFGRWRPYEADKSGENARSMMAQELQAYELFTMKAGLDYLMELGHKEVTVMAWQHDGLTLHFKDASKADRYIHQMSLRIERRAIRELKIPSWKVNLEREEL